MKLKITTFLLCILLGHFSIAQIQGQGGRPQGAKIVQSNQITTVYFQEPDIDALRAEDAITDAEKSGPWRFGYNHETALSLDNSGKWFSHPNGGKVWLLKVDSKNALTINLTLKDVEIPEGNELYVYNEDKSFILGKFTANELYNGELGTELIPGHTAILEYYVAPKNVNRKASLTIDRVTHGYRTASEYSAKAFNDSESCNMNVNCPDGTLWENQKRSVVMLVSGSNGFCTGALVNNVNNDGKPYVLTANHCYSNPATWVFRFNWESATCTNPTVSPTFQSLNGAILRARRTPTDFCLVEITGGLSNGTVPASYNPYFSGWDKSGSVPSSTVGIHHPSGDIKKIAFDDNSATIEQAMGSTENASSWGVVWNRNTTTEGGSSGSPLFDQNHRIIGQLWGGVASCSNLSGADYYGRFSMSWDPSGSNATNHLVTWLDPTGVGSTAVDGYDPHQVLVTDDGGVSYISAPIGTICQESIEPILAVKNYGTNNLTSIVITYSITGGAPLVYNWTGNLAPNGTDIINLPSMTVTAGSFTFTATSSLPNGIADNNPLNDSKFVDFIAIVAPIDVEITFRSDCYGDESTWSIFDDNDVLVLSGGPFADASESVNIYCMPEGCYTFKVYDSYLDGLTSDTGFGCNATNVGYWIKVDGTTLVSMTNAAFGGEATHTFCLGDTDPCDAASTLLAEGTATVSSGVNGSIAMNVSGGITPYSISWTGPGSFTSQVINLNNLIPGLYNYSLTDDCGTVVNGSVVVQSSVGISDVNAGDFLIYPNPSNGKFAIEFTQFSGEKYTISVLDMTGRNVFSTESDELRKEINLDFVSSGKYILNIRTVGATVNQSIVIKKE